MKVNLNINSKVQEINPTSTGSNVLSHAPGVAGTSSTMASGTSVVNPVIRFVTAIKDQLLIWVGTARAHILLRKLDGDKGKLIEQIPNADLTLVKGIIKILKPDWSQLKTDMQEKFFINLGQNDNYLEAYKLAYQYGIPFNIIGRLNSSDTPTGTNVLSLLMKVAGFNLNKGIKIREILEEFSKVAPNLLSEGYNSCSPYELALQHHCLEMILWLPKDATLNGKSLIYIAHEMQDEELMIKLLNSGYQSASREEEEVFMDFAVQNQDEQLVIALLKNGYQFINVEKQKEFLTSAVEKGWAMTVEMIVLSQPDIAKELEYELIDRALSIPTREVADHIVSSLLQARIVLSPEEKAAIFLSAVTKNLVSAVQTVLEQDPTIINSQLVGAEYLMTEVVFYNPNPEMVNILLRADVKMSANPSSGTTPLMAALKLLKNEKSQSRKNKLQEIITTLVGAASSDDLLAIDSKGRQALYYAIKAQDVVHASFILDKASRENGPSQIVMMDLKTRERLSVLAQKNHLGTVANRLSELDVQAKNIAEVKNKVALQFKDTSSNAPTSWLGSVVPRWLTRN